MSLLLAWSIKAALLLATSWLGAVLLRRSTAAARHHIWALGIAGVLALPLFALALPSLSVTTVAAPHGSGHSLVAAALLVTGGRVTDAGLSWPTWLALAWATGALVVALRFLRGHVAARTLWRSAEPAHPASSSALRDAAAALAIAMTVEVRRSAHVASPMTIGIVRPRVLLPATADTWSHERLRAVLMHELGHLQRRDTLVQLGAQLACALYWWNPLGWLAAARLRIEREHACDDLVLRAGVRPSSYAADLLDVVRSLSPDATVHAAVCMADRSNTEARLRRILDPATARKPVGAWLRFAARGIALAAVVTLACTSAKAAPMERAHLSVGAPSLQHPEAPLVFQPRPGFAPEPTVDMALVAKEVDRHSRDLEACYGQRQLVHPDLSGTIVMHWAITTTGDVAEQCITTDTVHDQELSDCVNKLIADSHFPAPRDGTVDVSFPFVFAATP